MIEDQRGVVAVIIAILAPLLIGFAALAVDVTYWYGTHESLQMAADTAAMTDALVGPTSGTDATNVAEQAANRATGSRYAFGSTDASASLVVTLASNQGSGGAAAQASYTVVVSQPSTLFLAGIIDGFANSKPTISATATAVRQAGSGGSACILATATSGQAISASGAAQIIGNNCGVFANSNASNPNNPSSGDAIAVTGSGVIKANSIGTVGGVYHPQYSGYVGGTGGNGTNINQGASAQTDPLSMMGNPVPMPALPVQPYPGLTTDIAKSGYSLAYTPVYSQPWGGCSAPAYGANCYIEPGTFTGGINTNTNSFNAYTGSSSTNGESTYSFFGGVSLGSNGYASFGAGTYYMSGPVSNKGVVGGYALSTNIPQFTIGGGTYYVNGGFDFSGNGSLPTVLGQGTYFFKGTGAGEGNGGGWALTSNVSNVTFTGGTYFFDGGLNLASYGTITFGPGIYYIANGDLNVSGSDKIIVNGATFVLEDGAAFKFTGGSQSLDMQAPSTNCVQPASYPVLNNANDFPYDGTNGQGICGVLIYQARNDTAASTITAGATDTVNGIIYAPSSAFTMGGAGVLAAAPVPASGSTPAHPGTLAVIASTITLSGSAQLDASGTTQGGSSTSTVSYLTH